MIKTFQDPDIIVTSQDGEYLMIVEVKFNTSVSLKVLLNSLNILWHLLVVQLDLS